MQGMYVLLRVQITKRRMLVFDFQLVPKSSLYNPK